MVVTANTSNTTCIYRYFGIGCVGQSVWYPVRYVLRPIELAVMDLVDYFSFREVQPCRRADAFAEGSKCQSTRSSVGRLSATGSTTRLSVSFQGEPPQRTTYTAYTHTKGIGDRLFPPWNFNSFYVVGPIEHLPNFIRSSFEIRGDSTARQ
jgi:hypothetical protein